jgi:CDP-diacylglycerol--glycerol-3-phosphate 3-phosphatidyltransferase
MNPEPVPLVNVANVLTVARIVLVPVFVLLVIASDMTDDGWRLAAAGAFLIASLTDYVDGWVARSRNLVTAFGKVADPIADKALTGTALVLLSIYDVLPWWVTVVILVREWGVTALRFWVLRYGVIGATRGGKLKTALQILAITWYLCPFPYPITDIAMWIMGAAVIVTVVTGFDYLVRAFRVRGDALRDAGLTEARLTGAQVSNVQAADVRLADVRLAEVGLADGGTAEAGLAGAGLSTAGLAPDEVQPAPSPAVRPGSVPGAPPVDGTAA